LVEIGELGAKAAAELMARAAINFLNILVGVFMYYILLLFYPTPTL
jgi:hypothetical protein